MLLAYISRMVNIDPSYDRRTILRTVGVGTVGGAFVGTGLASTKPGGGNGVGPCTCEEECPEGTFCGKVDDAPEAGETYTFSSDGESFSVTVESVTTDEDDEVVCFELSSDDDVEKVCVMGGNDTVAYTGDDLDGELCAPENPGGQQSEISNFSFCGAPTFAHYQIDFVEGEPICDLGGDGETYGGDRLVQVLAVNADGTVTQMNTNEDTKDDSCVETITSDLNFDASTQSASVEFDVGEECVLSLAGYGLPEGCEKFADCSDESQTLLACDTRDFDGGEADVTLSVDLDSGNCSACEE